MLEEHEDSEETNSFLTYSVIGALFLLLGASVLLDQPGSEQEQAEWAIKFVMILVVAAYGFYDQTNENNKLGIAFGGFGRNMEDFTKALIAGGLTAVVLVMGIGFSISTFAIISDELLSTAFVTLASPYVEELFFSGLLFFTVRQAVVKAGHSEWIAAAITGVGFSAYHWVAFGGSIELMTAAFIFRIICIIGVALTNSLGYGLGLHMMNNWLLVAAGSL